jgi:hypothetical protein
LTQQSPGRFLTPLLMPPSLGRPHGATSRSFTRSFAKSGPLIPESPGRSPTPRSWPTLRVKRRCRTSSALLT